MSRSWELFKVIAALVTALFMSGCMEVEEQYRLSSDGKVDARIVMKVEPQYESLVLPELKKKMRADLPPGMKLDASQRIDGKVAIVITGEGLELATISSDDQPMRFSAAPAGLLQQRYRFTLNAAKAPDIPIPHRVRVTLPGSIEQTNGRKIESDTVEFDLTNARRGAQFQATSTGFALSFGSSSKAAPQGQTTTAWLLPGSLVAIVLGSIVLVARWMMGKKTATSADASRAAPVPMASASPPSMAGVPDAARVFCSECGTSQAATRRFCSDCGAPLT